MLRAYKFGYAGAREVLLNKYGFDAAPLLLRPRAKALHGTARVVSNCINQYTKPSCSLHRIHCGKKQMMH